MVEKVAVVETVAMVAVTAVVVVVSTNNPTRKFQRGSLPTKAVVAHDQRPAVPNLCVPRTGARELP